MAVKEDNEEHCKVLLENGADPNVFGVKSDYFKTPLHRARTQKVVQLLLKYGADPNSRFIYLIDNSISRKNLFLTFFSSIQFSNSRMLEREINGQNMKSLLDVFLGKYPQAIEELFDHGITTNGQDLDAVGLQLIFNFDFFFKEGLIEKFKDDDNPDNYDDQNTDQVDNSKDENGNGSAVNEMAVHQKIVKSKENFLLKHPLADSFLYLKWQMIRRYFFLNIFVYWLFVFCFTTFLYSQQELYNCRSNRKVGNFTSFLKICTSF